MGKLKTNSDCNSAPFLAEPPADAEVAIGIAGVITGNLKRSGLFAPIDPAMITARVGDIDATPQFQSWKAICAEALVTGR